MLSFAQPFTDNQVPFLLQPISNIDSTIESLKEQLTKIQIANKTVDELAKSLNQTNPDTFNCQDGLSISEASKKASQYLRKTTFVQIYNNELDQLIKSEQRSNKKRYIICNTS